MASFFQQQEAAERNTKVLIFLYLLAVLSIVLAVSLAVLLLIGINGGHSVLLDLESERHSPLVFRPELMLWVCGATIAVIALGTLYKIRQLASGGSAVAMALGGTLLPSNSSQPEERRLLNVVEEMAIASGIAVPPVYVLEEEGINAFAAGFSPQDAVIGITRRALLVLNRDELQGVIGHEFSHILSGDMRLNIRLIGILHGILLIALCGYWILRASPRSSGRVRRNGGIVVLIGLALYVIGYIGIFFGRLIKSAVSRQREFFADASSVQFTRNPSGIVGALKKIGGLVSASQLKTPAAEEASHLFFGNALKNWFFLFATHPPLAERIRRFEPSFDGNFAAIDVAAESEDRQSTDFASSSQALLNDGTNIFLQTEQLAHLVSSTDSATAITAAVGQSGPREIAHAASFLETLPPFILQQARDPYGARALVLSVLLDKDENTRYLQLKRMLEQSNPVVYHELLVLFPRVLELGDETRLPLVDLALPALKSLSAEHYGQFRENLRALINVDERCSIFEYTLQRIVLRHLAAHFSGAQKGTIKYRHISQVRAVAKELLLSLAMLTQKEESKLKQSLQAGLRVLGADSVEMPKRSEKEALRELDRALQVLASSAPAVKKLLIESCAATVLADRQLNVSELELMRAIADALDCPLPPLAGQ